MATGGSTASATTGNITSITTNSAVANASNISDTTYPTTSRGVVFGTTPWTTGTYPPYYQNQVVASPAAAAGSYSVNLTGLASSTTYYVTAYTIDGNPNTNGIYYGGEKSFTTKPWAKLATFTDEFTGSTIDTTKWKTSTFNGGTITQNGVLTLANGFSNSSTNFQFVNWYDMSASSMYFQGQTSAGQTNVNLSSASSNSSALSLVITDTSMYFINGGPSAIGSTYTFTAGAQFYRLREASGTLYADTSPDGVTWTNRLSVLLSTYGYDFTANSVQWGFNKPNLGNFTLDHFNIIASTITKTQTAIARIAVKSTKTQPAIARVAMKVSKTQTAVAHIKAVVSKTQTAVAHIIQSGDVKKDYIYKVYSGTQFMGLLPYVTSEFGYSQEMNTAGSQITVTVGVSPDTSYLPSTTSVDDQTSVALQDENGDTLLTEGAVNIVGVGSTQTLIKNGNRLVVYEISKYHPNGLPVFNGVMQKWTASFGGVNKDEGITILAYSSGSDMDNFLIYTGGVSQAIQSVGDTNFLTGATWGFAFAQAVKTTTNTDVGVINLKLNVTTPNTSAYVTVYLCQGDPSLDQLNIMGGKSGSSYQFGGSNHIIATSSSLIVAGTTPSIKTFTFPTNTTLVAGTEYYFLFYDLTGSSSTLQMTSCTSGTPISAPFMSLYYQRATTNNVSYSMNSTVTPLYIELLKKGGNTISSYVDVDPSTGMLTSIMDDYNGQGGMITYTATSIQATGLSLPYTFKTNTTYEGLKAALSLAPDGFYYFVDIGTNVLYFRQASQTADILLYKGLHIETLDIVASIEHVANTVYFSGGIPSGQTTSLFKLYKDATSIANFGQKMARVSDNRVTQDTTANAIGMSYRDENKDEQYQTEVTILDSMMDISMLKPGMVIGFRGFGSFADQLLSQIVRIDRSPHRAKLTLGILPRRIVPEFERITRGLVAEQTIANPTSPS